MRTASKDTDIMPAWKKHSKTMGCHPSGYNILIKSEITIWCYLPIRKNTGVWKLKSGSRSGPTHHLSQWPMGDFVLSALLILGYEKLEVLDPRLMSRHHHSSFFWATRYSCFQGPLDYLCPRPADEKKSHQTGRGIVPWSARDVRLLLYNRGWEK